MRRNHVACLAISDVKQYGTYSADHGTDLPGTLIRADNQPAVNDQDVDGAHGFVQATAQYYLKTFRRNSFDNQGAIIVSTVHYGTNYPNAFWNGQQVAFGDNFAVKDVIAHELTHAVTQYTAGSEYSWQAGALNESFSDIFGAMVDRDDRLMGEDLPADFLGGEVLRDMADPERLGQPAHVKDRRTTCTDEQGVHTNSGIFNKADYNIATAIGKDKAEQVFYRALVTYVHPTASFEDARGAVLAAVADLYGQQSSESNAVEAGFNAVGLDGNWNPPSNDCTCAASAALSQLAPPTNAGATTIQAVSTLYQVRDGLLNGTTIGKHYRDLYYRYTGQISLLLIVSPALRTEGAQLLLDFAPGLHSLANGRENEQRISQAMVTGVVTYLVIWLPPRIDTMISTWRKKFGMKKHLLTGLL